MNQFCGSCGHAITSPFCPRCGSPTATTPEGTPVDQTPPPPTPLTGQASSSAPSQPERSGWRSPAVIGIWSVGLLVFAGLVVFGLTYDKEGGSTSNGFGSLNPFSKDPDRFDALYDETLGAAATFDEDADPDDADDLEAALGWDEDSDYKVDEFEADSSGDSAVLCFVNEEQDTYLYTSSDSEGDIFMGDGGCSNDADDAEVVIDAETSTVEKGGDMVPSAVEDLAEEIEARVELEAKLLSGEVATWLTENYDSDVSTLEGRSFESLSEGNKAINFSGDFMDHSFCVVNEATGAWAVSSNYEVVATGPSGAECTGT